MNPLKERTATTKAIKTLFISSVLLLGFMAVSLSLSQTALATAQGPPEGNPSEDRPTPQCPDETDRFVQGQCEADPVLVCPPNAPEDAAGDCISPETKPKELTCPDRPGVEKRGDKCIESNTPAFRCPGGTRENAQGQCVVQSGPNAGQIKDKEPTCAPGQGGPGGALVGTGANAKCEKDVTAEGTQKCPSGTKEIEGQCHVVVAKIPECPSDEFDLIDPDLCQTRPGRGNA